MKHHHLYCLLTIATSALLLGAQARTYRDDSLTVRQILDANGLDTIPVEVASSRMGDRVYGLSLFHQQLTTLPECLGDLDSLENLDIADNLLTSLPNSIGRLTRLRHISAYDNDIFELPPEMVTCKNLETVYLIRNSFAIWPEVFKSLPNLQMADLGFNHLTEVPGDISTYPALKRLYLNDNYLTELPASFTSMTLEVIHTAGNALCQVSPAMTSWLDTHDYYKEGSKWRTYQDCATWQDDSARVRRLLDDNNWTAIPVSAVTKLVNNKIVAIDISAAHRAAVQPLSKKTIVDHSPIKLAPGIDSIVQLRSLNLSGNNLTELPGWFGNLCHLSTLDLSGNNLTTLPAFMPSFTALDTFNVSGNKLANLPPKTEVWINKNAPDWKQTQTPSSGTVSTTPFSSVHNAFTLCRISGQAMSFSVKMAQSGVVTLALYTPSGKRVSAANSRTLSAGSHELMLATGSLVKGCYVAVLRSGNSVAAVRIAW